MSDSKQKERAIFWKGSALWSLGGVVLMVVLTWGIPAERYSPLPEALSSLEPLAAVIGGQAVVFITGCLIWTICGMAGMWRLARVAA